jgi:nucleoside-diphosphate-sugar epimerase
MRDFIYIDDVVQANLVAALNIHANGRYDVGTGDSRTFEEVLKLLEVPYVITSERDIPSWYQFYTCADSNKFLPYWNPQYKLQDFIPLYKQYMDEKFRKWSIK